VAAIAAHPDRFRGRRVATILCGSNLTEEQVKTWLD
jgi:threonine dehydratase